MGNNPGVYTMLVIEVDAADAEPAEAVPSHAARAHVRRVTADLQFSTVLPSSAVETPNLVATSTFFLTPPPPPPFRALPRRISLVCGPYMSEVSRKGDAGGDGRRGG
jgi:hypothetical protein